MNKKRLKLYLLLSAAIGLIFSFIAFISLTINSERFAEEFFSQNYQNIESGNSFALIPQLNSLMNQDTINCIEAMNAEQVFFVSTRECKKNFGRDVVVKSVSGKIKIHFKYSLSTVFISYLTVALVFSLVVMNLLLKMIFQIEDIERESINRVNEIARQVAHDIRSPLSTLNSIAAAMNNSDNEKSELIRQVVAKITSIAEDLLLQSKEITSRKIVTSDVRQSCLVNHSIYTLVTEKSLEFEDKSVIAQIVLRPTAVSDDVRIPLSPSDFSRILSNLINNSSEAIQDNPSIFIEASQDESWVRILITDFGKGIPPEVLEKLQQEPLSYGKDSSGGNGIGVFNAAQILKRVGGRISIQSKVNVGTQVILTIPIVTL
jgi:signal transduction histidine kinase